MHVILNHGALEPALPDVTRGMMQFMVAPRVRDREGLQDPADRLSGLRPDEEVEVIGHETIAEQSEWVAIPRLGECLEESETVGIIAKTSARLLPRLKA